MKASIINTVSDLGEILNLNLLVVKKNHSKYFFSVFLQDKLYKIDVIVEEDIRIGDCFCGRIIDINKTMNVMFVDVGLKKPAILNIIKKSNSDSNAVNSKLTDGISIGQKIITRVRRKPQKDENKGALLELIDICVDDTKIGICSSRSSVLAHFLFNFYKNYSVGIDKIIACDIDDNDLLGVDHDVIWYSGKEDIFDIFNLNQEIGAIAENRNIICEITKAIKVIDINYTPKINEKNIYDINAQLVNDVLQFISILNWGGAIVIDFLRMPVFLQKKFVNYFTVEASKLFLNIKVLGFTRLGLLEIILPNYGTSRNVIELEEILDVKM